MWRVPIGKLKKNGPEFYGLGPVVFWVATEKVLPLVAGFTSCRSELRGALLLGWNPTGDRLSSSVLTHLQSPIAPL